MLDQAKNEYVDCYTKKEMSAKSHICFLRGCPIYFCRIRKFMLALHSFRKNTKINKKGVMSAKSVEWRWLVVLGKVYGIVTCWVISISHSHTPNDSSLKQLCQCSLSVLHMHITMTLKHLQTHNARNFQFYIHIFFVFSRYSGTSESEVRSEFIHLCWSYLSIKEEKCIYLLDKSADAVSLYRIVTNIVWKDHLSARSR